MRRWTAPLVVLALVLAGCSSSGDGEPDPTVPTSPATAVPTTATTPAADIATIPKVIDEPYLNRVLAALEKVETSAVKVMVDAKDVPQQATEIIRSMYSDEWFTVAINTWIDQVLRDPELKGLKRPLGERRTTVERLFSVSPTCVWMAVKRDYSGSDVRPPPIRTEYVALRPIDPDNDPNDHNPTAWMIAADGFNRDGSEPVNECATA